MRLFHFPGELTGPALYRVISARRSQLALECDRESSVEVIRNARTIQRETARSSYWTLFSIGIDGAISGLDARALDVDDQNSAQRLAFHADAFPGEVRVLYGAKEDAAFISVNGDAAHPAFILELGEQDFALFYGMGSYAHIANVAKVSVAGLNSFLALGYFPRPVGMIEGLTTIFPGEIVMIGSGVRQYTVGQTIPHQSTKAEFYDVFSASVTDRSVSVLADPSGTWPDELRRMTIEAGARSAVITPPLVGFENLSVAQTALLAMTGVLITHPGILGSLAAAAALPETDVVVVDWGADAVLLSNALYAQYEQRSDALRAARSSGSSLFKGRIHTGHLHRDIFIDLFGAFDDETRFGIIGSCLLSEGFSNGGDLLGTTLERGNDSLAAVAALERSHRLASVAPAVQHALSRWAGRPVIAPFLSPKVIKTFEREATRPEARLAALGVSAGPTMWQADHAPRPVRDYLRGFSGDARIFDQGFIAQTSKLADLMNMPATGRWLVQSLALLSVEKWLRGFGG
jgi:hypothetical protein